MRLNLKWNGAELLLALGAVLVASKLLGALSVGWLLVTLPLWLGVLYALFATYVLGILTVTGFFIMVAVDTVWYAWNERKFKRGKVL